LAILQIGRGRAEEVHSRGKAITRFRSDLSVNKNAAAALKEIGSPQLKELIVLNSTTDAPEVPVGCPPGCPPLIAENIPAELRERPQWVAWCYEVRKGRQTKVPVMPSGGGRAKSNDPSTWGTFDAALTCCQRHGHPGIGFVFAADDDFFGIDLDACRNPCSGLLTPWAQEIVTSINSDTEASPSGTGVKIVGRGRLPADSRHVKKLSGVPTFGDKSPEIAVYDEGRFWCMTGQMLPGTPTCCEPRQEQLDALLAKLFPPKASSNGHAHSNGRAAGNWFDKLLADCAAVAEGQRSERDFALCAAAVRHGFTADEIWNRVANVGKFAEGGREYFDRTWKAAAEDVANDPPKRSGRFGTGSSSGSDTRPTIEVTPDEYLVNDAAVAALKFDDSIFERGALVTVVAHDGGEQQGIHRPAGAPKIMALTKAGVRERLTKVAKFTKRKWTKSGEVFEHIHPPDFCPDAVIVRGYWPGIRQLSGVVTSPVLRPDGTILDAAGFDSQTGLLYQPSNLVINVPSNPTAKQITAAADALWEVYVDFPFFKFEHKSTAVAFVLAPLARHAYPGPTPFFLVDSNTRGAGKGKLLTASARISIGRDLAVMTNPENDAEARKKITSIAIAGDAIMQVDNIGEKGLGGPALDSALTGTTWTDRLLGTNKQIEMPLFTIWCGSGNNVAIKAEPARRIAPIRLNSPLENPEERSGFRHPDLIAWVTAERARLLSAALTILRGYCAAGRPSQGLPAWGSFEGWSDLVRQAIVWAGMADPGLAREELRIRSDTEATALAGLIEEWPSIDVDQMGVTAAEALQELEKHPDDYQELRSAILEICPGPNGRLPDSRALGNKLRHCRGRVIGGKFFDSRIHRKTSKWFIASNANNAS
jgi:hypothetical protein